jgi:hypothetical protein
MITRLQPRGIARAWRAEVPAPVDVLNLIFPERWGSYRWYGVLVAPLVYGLGGSIRWMGRFERSLYGEQQAEKLFIVRYRSHRRFLAMTLNPYYLAINLLRERGVSRFEASFTHASVDEGNLGRHRRLLVAHYESPDGEETLGRLRELLEPVAGELVYASRESASIGFLDPPRLTDPTPLSYGQVAFFAPDGDALDGPMDEALVAQLAKATDGLSLQLYKRESPRANLPRLPGRNGR